MASDYGSESRPGGVGGPGGQRGAAFAGNPRALGGGIHAVQAFDGSSDPEVCCAQCGRYLGKDSRLWWDDYTCEYCHQARAA